MHRLLRALRPFLSFGWMLGTVFALGFMAVGADAWRTVLSERHASTLSCAAWGRSAPRPAWVRLHGCRLLADRRISLVRSGSSLLPAPVLVPLATADGSGVALAYVLLPRDFDRNADRVLRDRFEGLAHPLSGYRASAAYDPSLPVLHLDEPGVGPLALSVVPIAVLMVAFGRRLRRNLRALEAGDRIAERVLGRSTTSIDIVDISPLLALRRGLLVSAPCWFLAVIVAGVAPAALDGPWVWKATLGAVAVAIVGGGLFLWDRGRPSRVAMVAGIAPLAAMAFGVLEMFGASDAEGRWLAGAIAAYGALATMLLARALTRLRRDPARAGLMEIEREWLRTRRKMAIRLMTGKHRTRYLVLHATGIVLAAITSLVLVAAGLGGLGIGVGLAVFFALRTRAQRHALPNAAEAHAVDARTPVLYLRSFLDEDLVVQSRSYRRDRSISEWVAAQFNLVGPVVAIAKPGERLPQIGPYRIVLPAHGDWQAEVRQRVDRSAAIVVAFGVTQGLLWELGRIAESGALPRTCFVFPPVDSLELDWRWQHIDEHVAVMPQLEPLFAVDPQRLLMAGIGLDDRWKVVCSTIRAGASYEMAFAAMLLRGRFGDAVPGPTGT